jgi:hypothetical protein
MGGVGMRRALTGRALAKRAALARNYGQRAFVHVVIHRSLGEQFYTDAGKRLAQAAESGRSASAAALRAPENLGRPLGPAGPVDGCCVCVNGPRVPSTWGLFLEWAT